MKSNLVSIYGLHAVREALTHRPDSVVAVYQSQESSDRSLAELARTQGIEVRKFDPDSGVAGVEKEANHQGYVATIKPETLMTSMTEFMQTLEVTPKTALVVLNELQDPQNVGAIIRSAAAFGIAGVLIPPHNQAQVGGAVIKVSAGMAFRVPLVAIGNVNQCLRDLKEAGFWTYSLEGEGSDESTKQTYDTPVVFVLGNEGSGVRQKTSETCDFHLTIPIHPRCESLNVGAAAAVVFSGWSAQHPEALTQ